MKPKLFSIPKVPKQKGFSKTKTISWLAIVLAVLSIADQFLDWGIIDMLISWLDK